MKKPIKVSEELNELSNLMERWNAGEIDSAGMAYLVRKSAKKLDKINEICYCEENVCCTAHKKHVVPHQNCILR